MVKLRASGLLVLIVFALALFAGEPGARKAVKVEGVAEAKGQPLLFAKRAAWVNAMRTLAEQVLGVEFTLDTQKEGEIRTTVRGDVAPAGTARQEGGETLPTGVYRVILEVEIEPAPPAIEALPEITAEGKGDIAASRGVAAARAAAKAVALAQAARKVAAEAAEKSQKPLPRKLEGHAWYLGPVSERVEGNFYYLTAKFKIALRP